ncbi:MAG: DNA alkylation repair protein [Bacteroidota bacterium]
MNEKIRHRKGARKAQDIPVEVVELLNQGRIETVNLTEWLAVDHLKLVTTVFPELGIDESKIKRVVNAVEAQKKPSAMQTTKLVGTTLYQLYASTEDLDELLDNLSTHLSDAVRCYAPYLIALDKNLTLEEKLTNSLVLIADKHFGVREVVWMALRPEIDHNLEEAIAILSAWTTSEDQNIRRFTTESTRPRGVWCKPIERLKEHPEIALPILENLKADHSKYVQDSIGNWLNDASKSRPEFVIELCEKWQKEASTDATKKIIKRARRTIDKK